MTGMLVVAARTLAAHIWSATFQATILMIVVMLVSAACRRMSPAFRCWLYCIVLLRLCIPVEVILPVRASVLPDALSKLMSAGVTEQISGQTHRMLGAIVDKPAAMTDMLALAWLAGAVACG